MSLNKVMLIGRLGTNPEVRSVGDNEVANFSLATSESFGKDNEKKTEWHRVSCWGKLAGVCGKYLNKGSQVYVEGRIQTREYEKDGQKRYATDIVASRVQFLDTKASPRSEDFDDEVPF